MTTAVREPGVRPESSSANGKGAMPAVDLEAMGRAARQASRKLAALTSTQKNAALHAIADALEAGGADVLAQNELDIAAGRANGLSDALLDRLLLTPERMRGLADDTRRVAALPDPVGGRAGKSRAAERNAPQPPPYSDRCPWCHLRSPS